MPYKNKTKKEYMRMYRTSKRGVISTLYNHQVSHTKDLNREKPHYTKIEFKEWILSQPLFHELFNNWEKHNYNTKLKPSVDRIDDYKTYSFDNIQLMTWGENREKGFLDKKEGRNKKQLTPVLQFDLDGNFIKEYHSQAEASRQTKARQSHIWSCCNGRYKTAGGFVWKYKNTDS